jgi:hypothetical protein
MPEYPNYESLHNNSERADEDRLRYLSTIFLVLAVYGSIYLTATNAEHAEKYSLYEQQVSAHMKKTLESSTRVQERKQTIAKNSEEKETYIAELQKSQSDGQEQAIDTILKNEDKYVHGISEQELDSAEKRKKELFDTRYRDFYTELLKKTNPQEAAKQTLIKMLSEMAYPESDMSEENIYSTLTDLLNSDAYKKQPGTVVGAGNCEARVDYFAVGTERIGMDEYEGKPLVQVGTQYLKNHAAPFVTIFQSDGKPTQYIADAGVLEPFVQEEHTGTVIVPDQKRVLVAQITGETLDQTDLVEINLEAAPEETSAALYSDAAYNTGTFFPQGFSPKKAAKLEAPPPVVNPNDLVVFEFSDQEQEEEQTENKKPSYRVLEFNSIDGGESFDEIERKFHTHDYMEGDLHFDAFALVADRISPDAFSVFNNQTYPLDFDVLHIRVRQDQEQVLLDVSPLNDCCTVRHLSATHVSIELRKIPSGMHKDLKEISMFVPSEPRLRNSRIIDHIDFLKSFEGDSIVITHKFRLTPDLMKMYQHILPEPKQEAHRRITQLIEDEKNAYADAFQEEGIHPLYSEDVDVYWPDDERIQAYQDPIEGEGNRDPHIIIRRTYTKK